MVEILKLEIIPLISDYYQKQIGESTYKMFSLAEKYNCTFEEFEKHVQETKDEQFEEWDDYISWKAHSKSVKYLSSKIKKIEDGLFKVA